MPQDGGRPGVLNLITDPWIPVLRQHGNRATIAPIQLADSWDTDPVIAVDWPRADFRIATLELLTGLLATACPPDDSRAWLDWWRAPPTPDALAALFAPYVHAFELDGDGPRFLQDREDLVSGAEPAERLLIEAPGNSTVKKNTDLLVHRGQTAALGRPAAAIALYTFQSWAPAGGAGNRTGLRGGGPLTTFVLPGAQPSLWHLVWANVPVMDVPTDPADLPRIFPWLVLTVTSNNARVVTPETAHLLQAWWGMPRRIRLDFMPCASPTPCGLTGVPDSVLVPSWRQRPQGANYLGWGDMHPLTPRYRVKPNTEVLPLHPQPGGIGYRNWLGLVVAERDGLRIPAPAVNTWRTQRAGDAWGRGNDLRHMEDRLLAAGYDMDNMKARGFVESELPMPAIPDPEVRARVDRLARNLVRGADLAAGLLRRAVRDALFSQGASVKLDWEMLSAMREQVWNGTEATFHDALARDARRPGAGLGPEPEEWRKLLRKLALDLFNEAAPLGADGATLPRSDEGIRRLLRARRTLGLALSGYGKDGAALFEALELPLVETKIAKKGRKP